MTQQLCNSCGKIMLPGQPAMDDIYVQMKEATNEEWFWGVTFRIMASSTAFGHDIHFCTSCLKQKLIEGLTK